MVLSTTDFRWWAWRCVLAPPVGCGRCWTWPVGRSRPYRRQEGCNSTRSLDLFGPGRKLGQYVCLPGPLLYYCRSPTREIWTLRLKVYAMFYIRVSIVIIYLYIRFCIFFLLSGLDYSESFHISHFYDSGYLFLCIYHSLFWVIHLCTYVSLAT